MSQARADRERIMELLKARGPLPAEELYAELTALGMTRNLGRNDLAKLRAAGRITVEPDPDETKRNRYGGPAKIYKAVP